LFACDFVGDLGAPDEPDAEWLSSPMWDYAAGSSATK
jgi:hypothetical protein